MMVVPAKWKLNAPVPVWSDSLNPVRSVVVSRQPARAQ